jgi:hypothetical protein
MSPKFSRVRCSSDVRKCDQPFTDPSEQRDALDSDEELEEALRRELAEIAGSDHRLVFESEETRSPRSHNRCGKPFSNAGDGITNYYTQN